MPVNEMSFTQASAFLNEVQNQVTGVQNPRAVNTSEFVAVATTVLKTGLDPLLNAVNQVLGRTIFSIRPYSAKFRLAEMSETAFGNHTRKLSIADKPLVDKFKDAFKDEADVWMILNHILNVMLDFAVKVHNDQMPKEDNYAEHVFRVIYQSVKQYFRKSKESDS